MISLRAPFPWFGGKSRVAQIVWDRFGNVPNYVEPFFGSGAVLLARPHKPLTETVNDLDCYVANFWRAISQDAESVAGWADWPVNEADMLARHAYLLAAMEFQKRMRTEPDYCDHRIAGWWAWGLNIWIGDGWCRHEATQLPHLGNPGKGINRRLPHLGDPGTGINRRLPHLGNPGTGSRREAICDWFIALSERLRDVRVCCGEWHRVLGDSVTIKHGVTGIFLDPPYESAEGTYAVETEVSAAVREWATENGDNPLLRIALCGYAGQNEMPRGWEEVYWKARKGYQKVDADGRHGGMNERIWFSPHCLKLPTLFTCEAADCEATA